ncbi:MAG: cell surface protein [Verrucomicrobia bacterium]|nr:cell surface protein [Verrucomicrobiota bacterium]
MLTFVSVFAFDFLLPMSLHRNVSGARRGCRLAWALALVGCVPTVASAKSFRIPLRQTIIDGLALGVQAGDTLLLEGGPRRFLRIEHVVGQPQACVTITNSGGEVVIRNDDHYYDIWIGTSRFFRLTGSGDSIPHRGIRLAGTNRDGSALMIGGLSSDCEIDHLEISHAGFAGMAIKTDGAVGTFMDRVRIHDNYVHDTGGEGLYIGETRTPGQIFRGLEIWNNVVARTGYESCQIANAIDAKVHHNVFYRAGLREDLWQDNNIQLSAATSVTFDHNLVIGAYTNLVIAFGGGAKVFTDNFFSSSAAGPAFFLGDSNTPLAANTSFVLERNFFRDLVATQPVILFTGEKSVLRPAHNTWEGARRFLKFQPIIDLSAFVQPEDNREAAVARPGFVDEAHDDFRLREGDPYRALGFGPLSP